MATTFRIILAVSLALTVVAPVSAQSPLSSPATDDIGSVAILPMGRLVYASDRGGDGQRIWMLETGQAEPVRLTIGRGDDPTSDFSSDRWADLSPDGTTLIFSSDRETKGLSAPGSAWLAFDLWTVADGSEPRKIRSNRTSNREPVWSPDGRMIAFAGEPSVAGCKRERAMLGLDPRTGLECRTNQIFVMEADSTNVVQLTDDPLYADDPAWSPDGSRIAFTTLRHDEDPDDGVLRREIYVINADGSEEVRLTDDPASDGGPAWSPDGTQIAFESRRTGDLEVYVMNADGSDVVRLTDDPEADHSPSWSPDGTMIAFVSGRDGDSEIYIMNADGSGQVNVSRNPSVPARRPGIDWSPSWEP